MFKLQNVASALLLIGLCWSVFAKYKRLETPKHDTELDSLEMMLAPIKNILPAGSTIGFDTNTPDGRKGVLYFKSALVLAPVIVTLDKSDTILIVADNHLPSQLVNNYDCIAEGKAKNLNYKLVHRRY